MVGNILVSMKKYLYIIGAVIFIALATTIVIQSKKIESITSDRDRLSSNQTELLSANESFKTKDSLNAIKVKALTLTVDEYKKYRSGDAKVIKTLNADFSRLQKVGTIQTETDYKFKAPVRDSLIYLDRLLHDTLQCAEYSNKWLDFIGCYNNSKQFEGIIQSRESLIYEEHIIPKRFLGFLWKYGCKERRQNIISKNPYTKIVSAEFITIKE